MRTAAALENPHEALARERKAFAIARHIWAGLSEADQHDADTPWRLTQATAEIRNAFAYGARQNTPSSTTWEIVVASVCAMVQTKREGQPNPCPSCHAGSIDIRTCHHSGNCPCAGEEAPCDRCASSGHEPCESCGDPKAPGTEVTAFGLFCPDCKLQLERQTQRPRLQVVR